MTTITDDVRAVLDAVRTTGQSATPGPWRPEGSVSSLVFAVAVQRGLNPVTLQRAVDAYAAGQAS